MRSNDEQGDDVAYTVDTFLADFCSNPKRHVFVIDEIRTSKPSDQYAIYGLVVLTVSTWVDAQHEWFQFASKTEFSQIRNDVKGRNLYGSGYRSDLAMIRDYFEKWILRSDRLYLMFTSQEHIKLNERTNQGRIRFREEDGIVRTAGAELQPILSFIKGAANNIPIGTNRTEVVIDEAHQNSAGPIEEGKVKVADFQTFNIVDGDKEARDQCPTEFRLIRTPDQSPNFQHGLILPDAFCYLANKHNLLSPGKAAVDRDLFHIRELPLTEVARILALEQSSRLNGNS